MKSRRAQEPSMPLDFMDLLLFRRTTPCARPVNVPIYETVLTNPDLELHSVQRQNLL